MTLHRAGMMAALTGIAAAIPFATLAQQPSSKARINADSAVIKRFHDRVAGYVKLHNSEESALPALKPTPSTEEIAAHQHGLARRIAQARPAAKRGDIFSADVAAEFQRLISLSMQGRDAAHIHTSLQSSEPVRIPLRVNEPYPADLPVQSMPPTLLVNLPKLPPEVEFRIVGSSLVLLDTKANLIVDFMPNAIP